jgi:hypothetical protein
MVVDVAFQGLLAHPDSALWAVCTAAGRLKKSITLVQRYEINGVVHTLGMSKGRLGVGNIMGLVC